MRHVRRSLHPIINEVFPAIFCHLQTCSLGVSPAPLGPFPPSARLGGNGGNLQPAVADAGGDRPSCRHAQHSSRQPTLRAGSAAFSRLFRSCCATATSTRCATSRPISRPFPPPSILTNSRSKTDPKMTPSKRAGIPSPRGRRKLPAAFPPSSDRKNRGSRNTRKTAGVARNRGSFPANPDGDPRGKCGGRRSAGRRSVGRKSRGTRRGDCTSRSSGGGRVPRGD